MAEHEPPDNVVDINGFRGFRRTLKDSNTGNGPDIGVKVDTPAYANAVRVLSILREGPRLEEILAITKRETTGASQLLTYGNERARVFVEDQSVETLEFLEESAQGYHPEDSQLPGRLTIFYTAALLAGQLIERSGVIDDSRIPTKIFADELEMRVQDSERQKVVNSWRVGAGLSHLAINRYNREGPTEIDDCIDEGIITRIRVSHADGEFLETRLGLVFRDDKPVISDEVLGMSNPISGVDLQRIIHNYRELNGPDDQ